MRTGIEPTVDYAFKRVFGCEENCDALTEILNAVIEGSGVRPIRQVEILNPFSRSDACDDRLSILDIKARDDQQREWLIEMQMLSHANFRERLLWYATKHYAAMLKKGEDYSELRPVILVCFINDVLFEDHDRFHSRYELLDPESGAKFSDHITIHIVELPKFNKSLEELTNNLDRWTFFMKHGADLDPDQLPPQLQNCGIGKATGTLKMLSQNQQELDDYDARRMFKMDEAARIQTALSRGEAVGEVRGEARGEVKGQTNHAREMICRIGRKRLGEPPVEVVRQLDAMTDLDRLNELVDRVLDCDSWASLLPEQF